MKTNPSFRIFKFSTLVPLGIAIAVALLSQPVRASVINNIVLTENSSTSLTATYNGSPISAANITNSGPDSWIVTFPGTVSFNGDRGTWIESANIENTVDFILMDHVLTVNSDVAGTGFFSDGQTAMGVGTDSSNGASINAAFFDNAATSEGVPDTGSTLGLLSLSMVALLGATRLRFPLKLADLTIPL